MTGDIIKIVVQGAVAFGICAAPVALAFAVRRLWESMTADGVRS